MEKSEDATANDLMEMDEDMEYVKKSTMDHNEDMELEKQLEVGDYY